MKINKKIISALYEKEIKDILRDRKTILMMIVVPLILYPLIFLISMLLSSSLMNESKTKSYEIAFENISDTEKLKDFFIENQDKYEYSFLFLDCEDYEKALSEGNIKAYISESVSSNGVINYTVNYNASDNSSTTAASMLEDMLMEYRNFLRKDILEKAGLDSEKCLYPFCYSIQNRASNEKTIGNFFGYIVPFLLISSILIGAMYPAIDVTSGEKERATMETLLTLPISNFEMIVSKFLATSTIAVFAAFLNVISMGFMGVFFYSSIVETSAEYGDFNIYIYIPSVLLTLLISIVFATFSSAVCLSVCIFAKTFKEAQNYTSPVMLVFMFAGMASMFPSLSLDSELLFVPVVNFSLLIGEIFKFNFDLLIIGKVLAINIAYSVIAIIFMSKLFSSEEILFFGWFK